MSFLKQKKITHYEHSAAVLPRHAIGSSDSGQSKVLEMPEEPSLTCMRARAGLWCNCSNGEGQRPAQPVPDIKAQMWTQHLGSLAAVSVRFENGGGIPHGQHFVNRWKSSFNCVAAKMFYAAGFLTCSILLRSCILSLDPHDSEAFIQAVRLFKASHLPLGFYSQGSSATDYNGPSFLFMFQLRLQRSTVYQSKLNKNNSNNRKKLRMINFLYRSSSQIYCCKVVTASPLLRPNVFILFVLFPGCFESVCVAGWLIEPGQRTFFPHYDCCQTQFCHKYNCSSFKLEHILQYLTANQTSPLGNKERVCL